MPTAEQIQLAIAEVHNQQSFIKNLLTDTLNWPINLGFKTDIEDITYEWEDQELQTDGLNRVVLAGPVLQMQSLEQDSEQPWGIFILEFRNPDAFTTGRGLTGPLRKVLRGLCRRKSNLPAWDRENLLFICTHNYEYFRFAYFKDPKDKSHAAPLTTFGWEPGTPARTTYENLCYLEWPDDTTAEKWVSKWTQAFDVERVTNKFYDDYEKVFKNLQNQLELPDDEDKKMFAQTLMNRLMFLRFVERKGWLKFGSGEQTSQNYLRKLFEAGPVDNVSWYNSRLKALFFEGLAVQDHQLNDIIGDVPYLNGGLFEKHTLDDTVTDIPYEAFEPILGEQSLFYRYNFTVEESTPLDIEVAVNPEMLGKVFEELVTGRHESGSYYTPQPVVSFMCREAIKKYLSAHTDAQTEAIESLVDRKMVYKLTESNGRELLSALDNLSAVDPACGSGAYLLGLLHELILIYRLLYSEKLVKDTRSLYELKLRIISHNLYGVDKDKFAVNIAMLRLWLSLAVESEQPEPLPNLDFKIECGDSLTGACEVDPSRFEFNQLQKRSEILVSMKDKYLTAHEEEKNELREAIESEEAAIAQELSGIHGSDLIDWRVKFTEVFVRNQGFDIVLANPPYVNMVELETTAPEYREELRQKFETAVGGFDLFVPFMERGIQLLCKGGVLAYITPNKLLGAEYANKLRRYFADRMTLLSLTDLSNVDVFRASVYPYITIAVKTYTESERVLVDVFTTDNESLNFVDVRFTHRAPMAMVKAANDLWSPLVDKSTKRLMPALVSRKHISDVASVCGAAAVSEAYEWKQAILDEGEALQRSNPKRYVPFIVSGNIRRFFTTWEDRKVRYIKRTYSQPVLDTKHAVISARRMNQILSTKIIVSGMSKRPTCFWDDIGIAAGKSTVLIFPNESTTGPFLAALINSGVMNDIYHVLFGSLSLAGGYLRFGPPQVRALPFPEVVPEEEMLAISELVEKCFDNKWINCDVLEREIDKRVASLFGI